MDWEQFRRDDGTIDLNDAYNAWPGSHRIVGPKRRRQLEFLDNIEQLRLITSRQAAAIALCLATQVEN